MRVGEDPEQATTVHHKKKLQWSTMNTMLLTKQITYGLFRILELYLLSYNYSFLSFMKIVQFLR